MKHTFLILFLFVISIGTSQAQTYKLNRQIYHSKEYIAQPGDPYNPTLAGVSSAVIPGLGQMLSGEPGRGFAFLGGACLSVGMYFGGLHLMHNNATNNGEANQGKNYGMAGSLLVSIGAIGAVSTYIWSIFDAVKVAKINNMYFQDRNGNLSKVTLEINPFLDTNTYLGQIKTAAGVSLRITF